ncbi:MAG: phosphatidylserine decarboxylase [Thermoplasmatota archaeon]|jgi:phosphatidylserine decarboxylase
MRIAKSSLSWILAPLFLCIVFIVLSLFFCNGLNGVFLFLSFVLFLMAMFFLVFFRDPDRKIGEGVVCVADGKIREITKVKDDVVGDCWRVSTFMNLYNVHVNRMPLDGTILDVVHISGFHIPAFRKDSEKNERVIITIDTVVGIVKVVQVAGTIARRIVPYVKRGDKLRKGDRLGIIRFGSRVDLFLPSDSIKVLRIKVGDMVRAGVDNVAEIND